MPPEEKRFQSSTVAIPLFERVNILETRGEEGINFLRFVNERSRKHSLCALKHLLADNTF